METQRGRADALQLEKDALSKQMADLREKLAKALSELEEANTAMEHMVHR